MATIMIKGRKEPIEVDNILARQVKDRWCGNPSKNIQKADRGDICDLGDWCGEYGQIKTIELDKLASPNKTKAVSNMKTRMVTIVPLNYVLKEDEEFL